MLQQSLGRVKELFFQHLLLLPWIKCPACKPEALGRGINFFFVLLSSFLWNCFLCQDCLSNDDDRNDVPLWLAAWLSSANSTRDHN